MKAMIRIELNRALKNRYFLFAICLGECIVLYHIIKWVALIDPKTNVFYVWIGGSTYRIESFLYYFLLPILATIPYGSSFFNDKKTGIYKNICIRVTKPSFFLAKYLATFISGGLAFIIPLVTDLLLSACLHPSHLPQAIDFLSPVTMSSIMYQIFYSHPYIYVFFYLLLDFVAAGLFATIAICALYLTEYRFIVSITPFVLYLFTYSLMNLTGHSTYHPIYFLNPGVDHNNWGEFFVLFSVLFLCSFVLVIWKERKADVF